MTFYLIVRVLELKCREHIIKKYWQQNRGETLYGSDCAGIRIDEEYTAEVI
jgi:hypothetical protein